jgi:hypothetical protein
VTGVAAGSVAWWPGRSRDVKGPAGDHRRHGTEASCQRGGPQLWGPPGPGSTPCWRATGPRARPRSSHGPGGRRRPKAISPGTVELIVTLRKELAGQGLDAGPDTHRLAPGTPPPGQGVPGDDQPLPGPARPGHPRAGQRPRSSCLRFEAGQPNECWQSDRQRDGLHHAHPGLPVGVGAGAVFRA